MAGRYYRGSSYDGFDDTDGGEASPSSLKSRKLVDMMGASVPKSGGQKPNVPKQQMIRRAASEQKAAKPPAFAETVTKEPASDLSPSAYTVLSATPAGEGETVNVVLSIPDPEGGKHRKISVYLLVEQYSELGVRAGEISPETAETLLDAGRLCDAIRRGMAILDYGDQSARRLAYKLTAKGIDRNTADRAVAYLTERGYIREENTATLRARQGVHKGWGERRIREDLCTHGFTREAVEEAMEELSDVDWEENCATVIRKKYCEIPEERGDRQKMMAAMMRLGYDADTVKAVARAILREK